MRSIKTLTPMTKNLYRFAALTAFILTALIASARPPAYMKLGDIKGEAASTGTIQIESWSLGAMSSTSGTLVQGNRIGTDANACATGPFKFSLRGAEAEAMKKLCQSRTPLGTVAVDINGVKHHFENASFASCQTGDGIVPTDQFSLNFAKCTFHRGGVHVAAGDVNGASAPQANGRLIGLSTGPVPVHLESLKLSPDRTSATVSLTKVGPGTLILSSTNSAPLPQLVLELNNGTKWTFTRVTFGDIVVSSATGRPSEPFTLNFVKVVGPSDFSTR